MKPHTCVCRARWGGSNTAHCAGCHRTFSGPTTFDRHHRDGCLNPADLGMVVNAHGYWGFPSDGEHWTKQAAS